MAVPRFDDFMYPFISLLKDNDVTTKELQNAMIEHFGLTDEDMKLRTKGGSTLQWKDRIGWARQYLRRAMFISSPKRGVYHLTQRGRDYLQSGKTDLRVPDLQHYKEFAEYTGKPLIGDGIDDVKPVDTVVDEEILTPTEQLEQAFTEINNDLAEDILQKTLELSPKKFEEVVLDLMLAMGYGNPTDNSAKVTQFGHDDGIDGIIPQDKLGFDKIYIQAKRYKPENTVGKPLIHAFAGALDEQKATKGVFITTSSFSKEAKSFVDKASKKIILIDGKQLAKYMIEYNVGVSKQKTYEVKRIDSDYFTEE